MVRTRFAALAVAAGLGLLGGCSSLSRMNPFHRHPDGCPCEGTMYDGEVGSPLTTDGPVLGDVPAEPVPVIPPGGVPTIPPGSVSTIPQGQVPSLGPVPRLFAQPQPAPQTPEGR